MKQHIHSYKDLPAALYQIQDKYRNEPRAKSGILRGREFNMKDLYSFHATEEDLDRFYQNAVQAYLKIYRRLRLGDRTIFTYATGGDFSTYSHEFQTICDSGEDTIYINQASGVALNKELLDKKESIPEFAGKELNEKKAIEVGNIFKLGTRFSEAFDLSFTDEEGKKHPVIMASYGIGPSRLMGTLVEVYHDEKGMRWPDSVAPFQAHLLEFDLNNASVGLRAKSLYEVLVKAGVELLYDDRKDVSPGAKLAEADLIGIPMRLVISRKTGNKVEVKRRDHDSPHLMDVDDLVQQLAK
jgi:prolyl-tRNA synthetase